MTEAVNAPTLIGMDGKPIYDNPDFPATHIAHWSTGPVACCDRHLAKLQALGGIMGVHVGVENAPIGAQCKNCINEANK